jgi:hypothetical protein
MRNPTRNDDATVKEKANSAGAIFYFELFLIG